MKMTHVSNIIQLGLKELRSLGHDKILVFFILASFSIMIYSAANSLAMIGQVRLVMVTHVQVRHSPIRQMKYIRSRVSMTPRLIEW